MKLITSLTSPFGRKVRIALIEKRIDCALEVDIPWEGQTRVPEYNPLGKVPVLVLDDDQTLYDSRVIVEYLDMISPVSRLIPSSPRDAIECKRWEALADGIADAAATIFIEQKRPSGLQSADWVARQQEKINRGIAALSKSLGDQHWCHGNNLTIADIALGSTLGYLNLRFPDIDWQDTHPNLAVHYQKLLLRTSFFDTLPPVP